MADATFPAERASKTPAADKMMAESDEVDSKAPNKETSNWRAILWEGIKSIRVEPIMFFVMFGMTIKMVPSVALIQERACRVHFSFPDDICQNLTAYKDEKIQVQKLANIYNTLHTIIGILPAAVITMFAAPWSLKYGRRYPALIALGGLVLDSLGTLIFTASSSARLEVYLLSPIISGLTGNIVLVFTVVYSYMSDITDNKTRAVRYAFLEFAFIIAAPLGTEIGGQILKYYKFVPVSATGMAAYIAAFVWTLIVFKDHRQNLHKGNCAQMAKDFASTENIKKVVKTAAKKRPGNIRFQLWLIVAAMCAYLLVYMGTMTIGLQHAQVVFNWDATHYSNVSTVATLSHSLVMITAVYVFTRILLLSEYNISLVGSLSITADLVLRAASTRDWMFYYARVCGSFSSCTSVGVRSRLSKVIPKDEQGEIFALLATCESFMPILGTAMFPLLYNATVEFYPGMCYALAVGISLITVGIFWFLARQPEVSSENLQEGDEIKMSIVEDKVKEVEYLESKVTQDEYLEDKLKQAEYLEDQTMHNIHLKDEDGF